LVLGKVRGIQIEINASWLIIFGLVTFMLATSYFPQYYPEWDSSIMWILGSIMAILLFASVLLHELAHSIVASNLGIGVKKISLFIFGGLAQMEREPDEPIKELKIAIAGPAMSIFLFLFFGALVFLLIFFEAPEVIVVPFSYLSSINLILAIFNLVPAFPLDGGRVLRAAIWHFSGNLQYATKIASSMGQLFGYFLIFSGVFFTFSGNFISGIWFIFIGWFINQASQSSYQHTLMSDIFKKIPVSEFMNDNVVVVDYNLSVRELLEDYFYKYKFNIFPVIKDSEIIGIVNIDGVKNISKENRDKTIVEQIIIPLNDNLVINPKVNVSVSMEKLFTNGIGRILVMEEAKLLGIVSRTDILNYIRIHSRLE